MSDIVAFGRFAGWAFSVLSILFLALGLEGSLFSFPVSDLASIFVAGFGFGVVLLLLSRLVDILETRE